MQTNIPNGAVYLPDLIWKISKGPMPHLIQIFWRWCHLRTLLKVLGPELKTVGVPQDITIIISSWLVVQASKSEQVKKEMEPTAPKYAKKLRSQIRNRMGLVVSTCLAIGIDLAMRKPRSVTETTSSCVIGLHFDLLLKHEVPFALPVAPGPQTYSRSAKHYCGMSALEEWRRLGLAA